MVIFFRSTKKILIFTIAVAVFYVGILISDSASKNKTMAIFIPFVSAETGGDDSDPGGGLDGGTDEGGADTGACDNCGPGEGLGGW